MLKIVKCAWENSDVSSSVQDFHRLHFEIVTSAAASTPKEVRAYPQRGSGPVSQAHLERGLRLDLISTTVADVQPKQGAKVSTALVLTWGPFYQYGLTLIPACVSNYIHHKVWDEITYPFPNFNGCTVEV